MTGEEIIRLARFHFGEEEANSVSEESALGSLNAAIQEMYGDLPVDRMRSLIQEESVTLSNGRGSIENEWDQVLSALINDTPAVHVEREVIGHYDLGGLFESMAPLYHVSPNYVLVRPKNSTCTLSVLNPPEGFSSVETLNTEAPFNPTFHPALADLVASYMYAQEEDSIQANHYRAAYTHKLANALQLMEATGATE